MATWRLIHVPQYQRVAAPGNCSAATRCGGVTCKARRLPDYAARRAGGDPENIRRASQGRTDSSHHSASQRSSFRPSHNGSHNGSRSTLEEGVEVPRSVPAQSTNRRRRSFDYSTRRSGGDPENQRRRGVTVDSADGASQARDAVSSSVSTPPHISDGPKMDPRVQRRMSVDYAARRSGSGTNRVASRPTLQTTSNSNGSSSHTQPSHPPQDIRVQRRKSVDYATRRTAPTRSRVTSRVQDEAQPSFSSSLPPTTGPKMDPRVLRRRSVDYAARRSSANSRNGNGNIRTQISSSSDVSVPHRDQSILRRESTDYSSRRSSADPENSRRVSGGTSAQPSAYTSRPTPLRNQHPAPEIPSGNGVPGPHVTISEARDRVRRMAARRRTTPDYASRRRSIDQENSRRRAASAPAASLNGNGARPDNSNGAGHSAGDRASKPYIVRKTIPSYNSRRSGDFQSRPGHPNRRRSMARFTLAEVKAALANRAKHTDTGPKRSKSVPVVSTLTSEDYAGRALRSFERLMESYSDMTGVPMHALRLDPASVPIHRGRDPAERALQSLNDVVNLISRTSQATAETPHPWW